MAVAARWCAKAWRVRASGCGPGRRRTDDEEDVLQWPCSSCPRSCSMKQCPHRRTGVRWWRCERFFRAAAGSPQLRQSAKARGWVRKRWGGSRGKVASRHQRIKIHRLHVQVEARDAGVAPLHIAGMPSLHAMAALVAVQLGHVDPTRWPTRGWWTAPPHW